MSSRSPLSDNQRRVLCRLVFLALCALPTSFAVYTVFHRPGPTEWANRIKAELGVDIQIGSVTTPTPGSVVLRGVILLDPDTDERSRLEEVRIGQSAERVEVLLVEPVQIRTDALAKLLTRCSERLNQADLQALRWEIKFNRLTITDLEFDHEFAVVNLAPATVHIQRQSFGHSDGEQQPGMEAKLIARTSGETASLIEVSFLKTADSAFVEIDTTITDAGGDGALPCRLFRPWLVDMAWLGRRSEFRGIMELQIDRSNRVQGAIKGDVRHIELDRVAQLINRPLTGVCDLNRIDCRIKDSLIDSASFHLVSKTDGKICRTLVDAANALGVQTRVETGEASEQPVVPFSELAFDVLIDQGKLSISSQEVCEITRGKSDEMHSAYRIATDMNNNVLAICDNKSSLPLLEFGVMLNGDNADRRLSLAFLDRFRIPAQRTARSNEASQYLP